MDQLDELLESHRNFEGALEEDHLLEVPRIHEDLVVCAESERGRDFLVALLGACEHLAGAPQDQTELQVVPFKRARTKLGDVVKLNLELVLILLSAILRPIRELHKDGVIDIKILCIGPLPKG